MGCLFFDESFAKASYQRHKALVSAFEIIDVFAVPSLSPDMFEEYERVRSFLMNVYDFDANGPDEFLFI